MIMHDPRERVIIKGRVVLMPRVWRRCASGVTFDPPPSMSTPRPAPRRLSLLESQALDAVRTLGGRASREGWIGRSQINTTIYGHPRPEEERRQAIDDALTRLEHAGLIETQAIDGGRMRYRVAREAA